MSKLTHEEIVETWDNDSNGEYVQVSDGTAYYIAHGCRCETIPDHPEGVWTAIAEWMKASQYWPNIWEVNERGNVELCDTAGNYLGGLV